MTAVATAPNTFDVHIDESGLPVLTSIFAHPEIVELNANQARLEARINELTALLQQPVTDGRDADVRAVMAGKPLPISGRADADELYREKNACYRAIETTRKQIEEAERRISHEVSQQLVPAYREILQNVANAVAVAIEVGQAEQSFRDRLLAAGIANPAFPEIMDLPSFLRVSSPDSPSKGQLYLKRLADHYHIEPEV